MSLFDFLKKKKVSEDFSSTDGTDPNFKSDKEKEPGEDTKQVEIPAEEAPVSGLQKILQGDKKTLIIRAILAVGIIYFAIDILKPTPQKAITLKKQVTPMPEKVATEVNEKSPSPSNQESTMPPTSEEKISEKSISEEIPPESLPPEMQTETPATEENTTPPIVETPIEESKSDTTTDITEPTLETTPPPVEELPKEKTLGVGENTETTSSEVQQPWVEEKTESNPNVVTYTAPPQYLDRGRGLVYNCKDGHWACISGGSYSRCQQNKKWNDQEKKNTECNPVEVYATDQDCLQAQKLKVDFSSDTSFCHSF